MSHVGRMASKIKRTGHLTTVVFTFRFIHAFTLLKPLECAALNLYVEYFMQNRDGTLRRVLVRFECIITSVARMPVRMVPRRLQSLF